MLLRHLAEMFGTKFISTKTLESAVVPRATLQRLSLRLAERYHVLPLRFADENLHLFDPATGKAIAHGGSLA